MKKIKFFLTFLCAVLFFCACSPKPNMESLLDYQRPGARMSLSITDGSVFLAELQLTEDGATLTFTDSAREGISYRADKSGGVCMFYEDVEIPLDPSDELKCKDWFALFAIPADENIWRIKQETLGGIAVYVCRDGRITLYLDAATGLPLRIETEDVQIDVLHAEVN